MTSRSSFQCTWERKNCWDLPVPVVIQLYFLLSATVVLVSSTLILVVALELSTQCPQMRATSCTRMELLVNEDQLDLFPIIIPPVTMPRKAKSLCCRFKGAVAINKKPRFYPNYPVLEKNDHKQTKPNTHTPPRSFMHLGCWHYSMFGTSSFWQQPTLLTVSLAFSSHEENEAKQQFLGAERHFITRFRLSQFKTSNA